MKTWRWMTALAAGGALVAACTTEPIETDDDGETSTGGSTTSASGGAGGSDTSVTSSTSSTTSGGGGSSGSCADEATYEDCFDCYCAEQQAGCDTFFQLAVQHLYCGDTCGDAGSGDCSNFCADPQNNTPSTACETCVEGVTSDEQNSDLQAFFSDCQNDTGCNDFLMAVSNTCPAPSG